MADWLKGMADRDAARRAAINDEIKANGTRWAMDEIDRLRRENAGLAARIETATAKVKAGAE